ncbi:hypothetical protein N7516_005385 [Penicillium verrucosum]|uniref:uncharacterized protein n=1 Tax=Penicillium verrucosum TaxID=60171 RepID=UPI002545A39A|nr:uncharacterized protein N7516_005385 [Penicillium verrucosum]KAJ5945217.1 hypothetical protein N7516_005385 [Penicillium verrucosum]
MFGWFKSSNESKPTQEPTWNAATMAMEQPSNAEAMSSNNVVSQQPFSESMKMELRGGGEGAEVCCGVKWSSPRSARKHQLLQLMGTTMPHLRRQPNPRDIIPNQDSNAPGNLRAQFQTPPTRHTPTNPTHRQQQPPSTGPNVLTPDPVEVAGHPAAPINPFTIFGRPRVEQPPPQMMDDDDFDDDFDPRGHSMQELGNDGPLDFDDSFDDSQVIEGQFDDSDIDGEELEEEVEDQFGDEEDPDQEMHDREKSPSPLPPNLREISSLASWTVSSSKPGCGVAALRNPSPAQYWQSDGPQPHTLTLHFFKLVAVVRMRVYLDFELDESYTPTKMIFAAGMGGNDLVEFATWEGDGPCGWVDVPLEGVGGRNGGWVRNDPGKSKRRSTSMRRRTIVYRNCDDPDHEHDDECDPFYEIDEPDSQDDEDDPYSGNVLKAMVIQMRIMENHQNGKDTHVRGFQVFACDDSRRRMAAAPSASADDRRRRPSLRGAYDLRGRTASEDADTGFTTTGLDEPDWMGEPVIR